MSSITSASTAPVLKPVAPSEPKPPVQDTTAADTAADARKAPPPSPSPLPPGQGTRVNIFA